MRADSPPLKNSTFVSGVDRSSNAALDQRGGKLKYGEFVAEGACEQIIFGKNTEYGVFVNK